MKIDSLDGVSDDIKGLYVEKDGAFFLDVNGAVSDESVQVMRNTIANVKAEKEQLRLDREAADLKTADAVKQQLLDESKFEELATTLQAENEGLKTTARQAKEQAQTSELDSLCLKLATDAGKDPKAVKMLSALFRNDIKRDENGVLVGLNGESIEQLYKSKEASGEYDSLWKGSQASGANLNNAGGAGVKKLSDMTGSEEAAFAKSNPEDYAAMLNK